MRSRTSSAVALTSSPGAICFISRRIIPRFWMSARTAWATPGYWTLTATSRPSWRRARYTWPIEAAAIGWCSNAANASSSGSSSSDSITLRMSEKRTFGAASRSWPSLRWNSSRCSSGTRPTSRKLMTCPSFIAAPFIVPSAATICSAASRLRFSSAAWRPSSPRPRFAARVPSWRAAWPAARPDTRAVRAMREVGMRSLATRCDTSEMELIHTCYRIGDIDRSVAFYEALGFEERRRMPIRDEAINVFMGLPGDGDRLELTYNHGVGSYDLGTGYNHIALTVEDLDATLERLAGDGIDPEKPPYRVREGGSRICFVRDPDGYRVELIERAGS